jgi:hypothetical protein
MPNDCARSGHDEIEPLARFLLGVSLFLSQRLDDAELALKHALDGYSTIGDRCGTGRSTATLGVVALLRGDWSHAGESLERALSILADEGDGWGQGLVPHLPRADREGFRPRARR